MFEENELFTLILGVLTLLFIVPIGSRIALPGIRPFCVGLQLLVLSYFFTNMEAFFWIDLFNLFEHGCMVFAGVFFYSSITELKAGTG